MAAAAAADWEAADLAAAGWEEAGWEAGSAAAEMEEAG